MRNTCWFRWAYSFETFLWIKDMMSLTWRRAIIAQLQNESRPNLQGYWLIYFGIILQSNRCIVIPLPHCEIFPWWRHWPFVRGIHRLPLNPPPPLIKASNAELCFFYLRPNNRLGKHSKRRWFEMSSRSLWHHCSARGWNEWWTHGVRHVSWLFIKALSIFYSHQVPFMRLLSRRRFKTWGMRCPFI